MSDSCNPGVCYLPGSSVHRISQARILGWIAISRDQTWGSCAAGGLLHWGWPATLQMDSLLTEPPGWPPGHRGRGILPLGVQRPDRGGRALDRLVCISKACSWQGKAISPLWERFFKKLINFSLSAGSSLLHVGFLCFQRARGLLSSGSALASPCQGFSCCEAQALGPGTSVAAAHGVRGSAACGLFPDQGS